MRPSEVGSSSCRVGEAGAVAVPTGGREAETSRRSTATGKQRRDSGRIRSWSRSGAVKNGGGESAPVRLRGHRRGSSNSTEEEAHGPVHDGERTASPALGRRAAVNLVRWGRHGGGAEVFVAREKGAFGEKVIWRP